MAKMSSCGGPAADALSATLSDFQQHWLATGQLAVWEALPLAALN